MTRLSGLTLAGLIAALAPASARAQTFGADWALSLERLVSGIKVATRQDSASTEQSATTATKAAEANASAITASDSALRIAQAKHAYSYDTGSGYSACGVSLSIADERSADRSATNVRQAFTRADRTWLREGGDGAERLGASLDLRRSFYCTTAEQKRTGWCSNGGDGKAYGYGAGDSDASVFLLNRSYGSEEAVTAADYLDVAAPLPTVKAKASTAEEDARRIEALRQGAMMTAARAAMMGVIKGGLGGDKPSAGGS
jgi:hypothetical protein